MEIVIITNGDIYDLEIIKKNIYNKYIICADGAAKYLKNIKVLPHLLIGDFDSIDSKELEWFKNQGVTIQKFPVKKDATDTELALEYGMKMNPKSITILGALGSRQDHSIANIMLLYQMLQKNIQGKIITENSEIMITDDTLYINGEIGEIISIIPLCKIAKGVTLKGLEYPLNNKDITMGTSLGISNVFSSNKAIISVKEGILLVIKSKI